MAAWVKSVETLTITLSSTNTSNTGSTTLGQTAADCILFVTQKTPRTADENYGTRLIKADISGSTVTIRRGTGTDIGTITAIVTVVECTTDCVVSTADTSISGGSTSNTATVSITDTASAFMVFSISSTYSPGDTSVATNPICRGQVTDTTTLTFTRAQSTNSITARWYLVECINDEFSVQRGAISLANSAESNTATISAVTMAQTFTLFSLTGANTDDWLNTICRCWLGSTTTVNVQRGDGGAAGTFSLTIEYQAVSMTGGSVQRGNHTITGTSASTNITAVDLDASFAWNPGLNGMGEGNSTDGDDVGQFWAAAVLVDADTVQQEVVTDSTTGTWAWEVIEFELEAAGDPVSFTLTGQGEALANVTHVRTGQGESLAIVTQTRTGQGEELARVSASVLGQSEDLARVGLSLLGQGESLARVGAVLTGEGEVLALIALTRTGQGESLQRVGATMTGQHESGGLAVVTFTMTGQLEVLARVSAPLLGQGEGLARVVATNTGSAELLALVRRALTGQAEAVGVAVEVDFGWIHDAAMDALTIPLLSEEVVYRSLGAGPGIPLRAVIERGLPEPLQVLEGRHLGVTAEVWLGHDPVLGVMEVAVGRDTIDLVLVEGEPPVRCLVTEVLSEDEGIWHLLVHR